MHCSSMLDMSGSELLFGANGAAGRVIRGNKPRPASGVTRLSRGIARDRALLKVVPFDMFGTIR